MRPEQNISIEIVQDPNYWWLLVIAIFPIVLTFFLTKKKTLSKGKGKSNDRN